jgi:hypothetical protein
VCRSPPSSTSGIRLWTLIHAQALLADGRHGIHDTAFIEDDRRWLRHRS